MRSATKMSNSHLSNLFHANPIEKNNYPNERGSYSVRYDSGKFSVRCVVPPISLPIFLNRKFTAHPKHQTREYIVSPSKYSCPAYLCIQNAVNTQSMLRSYVGFTNPTNIYTII